MMEEMLWLKYPVKNTSDQRYYAYSPFTGIDVLTNEYGKVTADWFGYYKFLNVLYFKSIVKNAFRTIRAGTMSDSSAPRCSISRGSIITDG